MNKLDTRIKETIEGDFIVNFNNLSEVTHNISRDNGWWDDRDKLLEVCKNHSEELGNFAQIAIDGLGLALEHSELSEVMEGIREGNGPDDKIPEFTSEEAESADVIIRIMDRAYKKKLRVAEAIVAKINMNSTRSYKHGGKLA